MNNGMSVVGNVNAFLVCHHCAFYYKHSQCLSMVVLYVIIVHSIISIDNVYPWWNSTSSLCILL